MPDQFNLKGLEKDGKKPNHKPIPIFSTGLKRSCRRKDLLFLGNVQAKIYIEIPVKVMKFGTLTANKPSRI